MDEGLAEDFATAGHGLSVSLNPGRDVGLSRGDVAIQKSVHLRPRALLAYPI
jgi:hypothetical protein